MLCCVWVCPRLGEYFTWGLLELGDADRHTHCVHTTIILSHWLISSFPTILTASSSMAPTLSSLAQTPTRAKLPSWVFLPTLISPKFLSILATLGRESRTWRLSKCHPSSHTRHTYACPCVHTQWIFSFNEAICPVHLARFLYFIQKDVST